MTDEHEPKSDLFRYAYGHEDAHDGRAFKVAMGIVLAAAVAALAISLVAHPAAKPIEVKAAQASPPPVKDVRIVPLYRKVEERAPMEAPPVTETTIEKAPTRVALKDDQLLPPPSPPLPPSPPPKPPQEAAVDPEASPVSRHWHEPSGRHHRTEAGEICERHGMHKVMTHNGKSWRCSK